MIIGNKAIVLVDCLSLTTPLIVNQMVMSKLKVLIDFSKYKETELADFVATILSDMAGNTNFPAPTPPLATLQANLDAFNAARLLMMTNPGTDKTAAKDQARGLLEDTLGDLGLYVQLTCKNDLPVLLSSGFETRSAPHTIGILPKPENFKVVAGITNAILSCKSLGTSFYDYQSTVSPVTAESNWLSQTSSGAKNMLTDLVSGQQYGFRMAGIGTDSSRVFSDVVMSYIL